MRFDRPDPESPSTMTALLFGTALVVLLFDQEGGRALDSVEWRLRAAQTAPVVDPWGSCFPTSNRQRSGPPVQILDPRLNPRTAFLVGTPGWGSRVVARLAGACFHDRMLASYFALSLTLALPASAQRFGPERSLSGQLFDARSLEAVDLDLDGDLDLLSAAGKLGFSFNGPPYIVWLENLGDGSYAPRQYVSSNSPGVLAATAIDVDGDGDLDVVGGGEGSIGLFWHEAGPHWTFGPAQGLPSGSARVTAATSADFDGDGADDLLVTVDARFVAWHRNLPNGSLGTRQALYVGGGTESVKDVAIADVTGSGSPDVVVLDRLQGSIILVENMGAAGFAQPRVIALQVGGGNLRATLAAGDLDGDGDVDMAFGREVGASIGMVENLGQGIFAPPRVVASGFANSGTLQLEIVDMDGDGLGDLVADIEGGFSSSRSDLMVFTSLGGGAFSSGTLMHQVYRTIVPLVVGDLTGNGEPDVAFIRENVVDLVPQVGGAYEPVRNVSKPTSSIPGYALSDLDRDGDLDVVTADAISEELFILFNEGDGVLHRPTTLDSPVYDPESVAAADMDGDGYDDLLVQRDRNFDPVIELWRNMGASTPGQFFPPVTIFAIDALGYTMHSVPVDMEGDGDLDVLTVYFRSQATACEMTWIRNDGTAGFTTLTGVGVVPSCVSRLLAGDLDGDGDADAVILRSGAVGAQVLENLGAGIFGAPQQALTPITDAWNDDLDIGDVDLDGDLDLVGSDGVDLVLVENLGGFSFAAQRSIASPGSSALSVRLRDLDLDGDLDAIATTRTGNARWYKNLGQGVFGVPQFFEQIDTLSTMLDAGDFDGDGDVDVFKIAIDGLAWHQSLLQTGAGYCSPAEPNSTGEPAVITASGSPSVASNALVLSVGSMPPATFGYFLVASDAGFIPGVGGSQGTLCVGGTVGRLSRPGEIFVSSVEGRASLGLDLTNLPTPTGPISALAGDTFYAQAWFRDANPTLTSNFTGGLRIDLF